VVETVNGTSTTVPLNFSSSQPPVVIEPKYVLGIDIGTGMHWTLVGESNGSDIAASMGLRVQF
jgi:hypothetical protein